MYFHFNKVTKSIANINSKREQIKIDRKGGKTGLNLIRWKKGKEQNLPLSLYFFIFPFLSKERWKGKKKRIVNSEIFTPFFQKSEFFHVTSQENRKKEKNRHSRKNGRIRCELINFNVSNVMSDEYIRAGLRSIHQESTHPSDFGTIKANPGRILSKAKQKQDPPPRVEDKNPNCQGG